MASLNTKPRRIWTHPSWERFQSRLIYTEICIKASGGFRLKAYDEKADKLWLVHDSGMWAECFKHEDQWMCVVGFVV